MYNNSIIKLIREITIILIKTSKIIFRSFLDESFFYLFYNIVNHNNIFYYDNIYIDYKFNKKKKSNYIRYLTQN